MLKTKRLLLRQWNENDFNPLSKMCGDKDVMEYFPNTLSIAESLELGKRIQSLINDRGWGFWAIEVPEQHQFIGFVGLHIPNKNLPFSPCVEVGWRLAKEHWNKGYATEAATASLDHAFNELNLNEVVSFTTKANFRSMAVMQKIGMHNTGQNFMHPNIEPSHPQCEHVLYKISQTDWRKNSL